MSYSVLIIRNGEQNPERRVYISRSEYERAKTHWKKIAKRNRRYNHLECGTVIAVIPQCERMF